MYTLLNEHIVLYVYLHLFVSVRHGLFWDSKYKNHYNHISNWICCLEFNQYMDAILVTYTNDSQNSTFNLHSHYNNLKPF